MLALPHGSYQNPLTIKQYLEKGRRSEEINMQLHQSHGTSCSRNHSILNWMMVLLAKTILLCNERSMDFEKSRVVPFLVLTI